MAWELKLLKSFDVLPEPGTEQRIEGRKPDRLLPEFGNQNCFDPSNFTESSHYVKIYKRRVYAGATF